MFDQKISFKNISALKHIIYGALTILSLFACDDEDKGISISKRPLLNYNPQSFSFSVLSVGNQATSFVKIENLGQGDLRMTDFNIDSSSSAEFSLKQSDQGQSGAELLDLPQEIRIVSGASTYLALTYDKQNETNAQGNVVFKTNDSQNLTVNIPIVTGLAGAELRVDPSNIVFDSVEAGQTAVKEVTLSNTSVQRLEIYDLKINGSADFTVQIDGETVNTHPLQSPIIIESTDQKVITVTYQPQTAGPDIGELQINSNDGVYPNFSVAITANGATPCMEVVPTDLMEFGNAPLVLDRSMETPNHQPLLIKSCGNIALEIKKIEFEGAEFGLHQMIVPEAQDLLATIPAFVEGEAYPSISVEVGFWPSAEQIYSGRLLIYTNVSVDPYPVDLVGRGAVNACPIPDVLQDIYDVQPLDIITLDGSSSVDPGGSVKRWSWSVVQRPSGSVSQIVERLTSIQDPAGGGDPDDENTPTAIFFVDLAGHYEIELKVYDELGLASCDPRAVAKVSIDAVPKKDLHIQLVWSTPADPDETDNKGTDIDLHLRHQLAGAGWGSNAMNYDCFFNNKTPDWGRIGDVLDNPSLDIDDTNGAGPENINLNEPEVGVTYEIGALYYRAESSFGSDLATPGLEHESLVTLRIYVRGELLAEYIDQSLMHLNDLWSITKIEWCEDVNTCPKIVETNAVYADGEY